MSRYFTTALWLGLVALLAPAYILYQQAAQQKRLDAQLSILDDMLTNTNSTNERNTENALRGIQAAIVKNQNQPDEIAILKAAESFHNHTKALLDTVQTLRTALLLATKNSEIYGLRHRDEMDKVALLLGTGSWAGQALRQQLVAYKAHAHQLHPADSSQIVVDSFDHTPVVAALAMLTQVISDILVCESQTLLDRARYVGARQIPTHLRIMAGAESNTVAPGATYRAKLLMSKTLLVPSTQMRCNGQPITVTSDGVGHVRFRAPQRLGPATWTGSIRFNQNGRDTTFQVRVPYRVARR